MKYLIKTRGTASIPDYLQIRDESFRLIAHCTISKSVKTFKKLEIGIEEDKIQEIIKNLPFGKLVPIET